jgi:toxin HigB-1
MIKSIVHKGLKKFVFNGETKGVNAQHITRLKARIAVLDVADSLDVIRAFPWDLHQLKGDKAGQWAIKVTGNWRLFFEFVDGDVYLLDYDDYH